MTNEKHHLMNMQANDDVESRGSPLIKNLRNLNFVAVTSTWWDLKSTARAGGSLVRVTIENNNVSVLRFENHQLVWKAEFTNAPFLAVCAAIDEAIRS